MILISDLSLQPQQRHGHSPQQNSLFIGEYDVRINSPVVREVCVVTEGRRSVCGSKRDDFWWTKYDMNNIIIYLTVENTYGLEDSMFIQYTIRGTSFNIYKKYTNGVYSGKGPRVSTRTKTSRNCVVI